MISDRVNVEEYVLDTPDEPRTDLEDLLEDSARVYHHTIATFQLDQRKRYEAFLQKVVNWGNEQIA